MQSVSAKFLSEVATNHTMAVKVEFVFNGTVQHVIEPSNPATTASPLAILDGQVVTSKRNSTRSTFTLKLLDPTFSYVPGSGNNLLTPYGTTVNIYRGVKYSDQTLEYVRLGTFRINKNEISENNDGAPVMSLSGSDLSRSVARNVLSVNAINAVTISNGLLHYAEVIQALILYAYPAATFNDTVANWITFQNDTSVAFIAGVGVVYNQGADLWAEAVKLAKSTGCDLYCDRYGVFTMISDPSYTYTNAGIAPNPVAAFTEGSGSVFFKPKRTLDDQTAFNQWIITGNGQTNTGQPIQSVPAQDTDVTSPTYIGGTYGIVTKIESNPLMYTLNQINSYAQLKLRTTIGGQELVAAEIIPNPALDIDDVVVATRSRSGLSASLFIIDSTTVPLLAKNAMLIGLRERRALV